MFKSKKSLKKRILICKKNNLLLRDLRSHEADRSLSPDPEPYANPENVLFV